MLDYICWKYYFQSSTRNSILEHEARWYEETNQLTEVFNMGLNEEFPDAKLSDVLSKVIQANPGIADYGAHLPSGLEVILPNIDLHDTSEDMVQLWD